VFIIDRYFNIISYHTIIWGFTWRELLCCKTCSKYYLLLPNLLLLLLMTWLYILFY